MIMTCDNDCKLAGWTEYYADAGHFDLHISVAPNTDLDDSFRAFCHDDQEMITVNGWLFCFEQA